MHNIYMYVSLILFFAADEKKPTFLNEKHQVWIYQNKSNKTRVPSGDIAYLNNNDFIWAFKRDCAIWHLGRMIKNKYRKVSKCYT